MVRSLTASVKHSLDECDCSNVVAHLTQNNNHNQCNRLSGVTKVKSTGMSQNCARQLNCVVGRSDWPDKALPASKMFVARFLNKKILNSIQYFEENSSKHLRWVSRYSYDNDRFQKCISLITCAVKNLLTSAIYWNKLVKWNLGGQTITHISQLICGQSFSFSRAPDNQKHTLKLCKSKLRNKKSKAKN